MNLSDHFPFFWGSKLVNRVVWWCSWSYLKGFSVIMLCCLGSGGIGLKGKNSGMVMPDIHPFALGSCMSLASVISAQYDFHKYHPLLCYWYCYYCYCSLSHCFSSRKLLSQSVTSAFCSFLTGEDGGKGSGCFEPNFQLVINHKQPL